MSGESELRLRTERLELVAGNLSISEAEIGDRDAFAALLGAEVGDWPPPLNDDASIRYMRNFFAATPRGSGWGVWYFLLRRPDALPVAIGNGGFMGRPDADGRVELGYSLLEPHQGKGYASEAVGALLDWAFSRPEVSRVEAQTLPELSASIRLLEKLDFRFTGPGSEPGAIRFARFRPVETHEETP